MRVNDNLINNQLAPSTEPLTSSTARAVSLKPLGAVSGGGHVRHASPPRMSAECGRIMRTLIVGGASNPTRLVAAV